MYETRYCFFLRFPLNANFKYLNYNSVALYAEQVYIVFLDLHVLDNLSQSACIA